MVRRFRLRHRGAAGAESPRRDEAIIKPGPVQPAVDGGFTIDDFDVDIDNGTVTCPNGITRLITPRRSVTVCGLRRLSAAQAVHQVRRRPDAGHGCDAMRRDQEQTWLKRRAAALNIAQRGLHCTDGQQVLAT